ncbi:MAG: hypothetical protein JW829_04405 [Pirellulales bacterium]|nr:hypothetical protein [Pirellulales bacterium]
MLANIPRIVCLALSVIAWLWIHCPWSTDPVPSDRLQGAELEVRATLDPDRLAIRPDKPNVIRFPPQEARFVRLVIDSSHGEPCIDELEIFGSDPARNLALERDGAKATASSCLPGYPIHQIKHLNDGEYGNARSWIAATARNEWAQIELPKSSDVAEVVFSRDRTGHYRDRLPFQIEIQLSLDGKQWETIKWIRNSEPIPGIAQDHVPIIDFPDPFSWDGLIRYAFLCELETWQAMPREDHLSPFCVNRPAEPGGKPYWPKIARMDSLTRTLTLMDDLVERLAAKGLDVSAERVQLAEFRVRIEELDPNARALAKDLYLELRWAKRRLLFRDPDLAPLGKILFVKRHPYEPSHNYSDYLDSKFRGGGGICILEIPRPDGRLVPEAGNVRTLFDGRDGIARDPIATFDAKRIYFAYRPSGRPGDAYWHLMAIDSSGDGLRQLTDGPFHDYYPCPLPDGGIAFVSTRCRCRYLCWVPMSCVLFRMDSNGNALRPLSYANLSEWGTAVMRDGSILWTRSEYLDKGADFGHTLWAIQPNGTQPSLLFGNNTTNCYMNAHEVPGTYELCCTLISHGGDFNGPIGLIDLSTGPFNPAAITNITPDVRPRYHMDWAKAACFRDPIPISSDYVLVSHAPADRFGLYVIDRYGNREILYLDPEIGSMSPTPLREVPCPPILPVIRSIPESEHDQEPGHFIVADVYEGLGSGVPRGMVQYLRVCQEVRSDLERLPNGSYREQYPPFEDYYAAPTHKVTGPHGWPSFVAKTAWGIVPVESDGSASFVAPAGKVLYFQLLDGDFNEIQRMRSVVQLQPGEVRGCIGCHEDRILAPSTRPLLATSRPPRPLQPPSWGAAPFSYEKVVQPVWDAKCTSCHHAGDKDGIDLTGSLDAERVPASYRTLITQGWIHHLTYAWGAEHNRLEPLTFGTVRSKLWEVLNKGHYDVHLSADQMQRIKCWTDLNCPLWPDYQYRLNRSIPGIEQHPQEPSQ